VVGLAFFADPTAVSFERAPDIVMEEFAQSPRRRMFKTGLIEFEGVAIKCAVENLSDTGAALQLATPHYIPDRFTLSVSGDQFRRRCHIIWRKEKLVGVAFD